MRPGDEKTAVILAMQDELTALGLLPAEGGKRAAPLCGPGRQSVKPCGQRHRGLRNGGDPCPACQEVLHPGAGSVLDDLGELIEALAQALASPPDRPEKATETAVHAPVPVPSGAFVPRPERYEAAALENAPTGELFTALTLAYAAPTGTGSGTTDGKDAGLRRAA